jgi:hypothetical protein
MSYNKYSEHALAIDLVMAQYQTSNPVLISEYIYQDLDMDLSIHAISDYLDINKMENYYKQSKLQEYNLSI